MTRVDIIDSVSVRTRNNSQLRTMNELATEQTYFELYNQSTWYFSELAKDEVSPVHYHSYILDKCS